MDPEKKPETIVAAAAGLPPPRLDCIKCFDALWFCYSPFHQMQSYYRYGEFDNCFGKWGDLVDCLSLKTKRKAEVEEILVAREKARPHIWTYRTVDEASEHWWRMYKHIVTMSPRLSHRILRYRVAEDDGIQQSCTQDQEPGGGRWAVWLRPWGLLLHHESGGRHG